MRILVILSALAIVSASLVFAHIVVTYSALLVTLVLGLIAGVADVLRDGFRHSRLNAANLAISPVVNQEY